MGDRVGAIGGTLEVDSAPGRGTRVSGVVPIDRH
jgi:signal transduction histidine kinase